jgi:hypothetical protein
MTDIPVKSPRVPPMADIMSKMLQSTQKLFFFVSDAAEE